MRRRLGRVALVATTAALLTVASWAPAMGAGKGTGELNASFHAGLSSGPNISPFPAGRLEPFGFPEEVCDQQVVGTWVFVFDTTRDLLGDWTNEFKLDGVPLEIVRTPLKRGTHDLEGNWWFAEGVPVLGVLDPGVHTIEYSFDDGHGTTGTIFTSVDVDASYC